MSKLAKYLNRHIVGNVFDRPTILQAYTLDRSILEFTPRLLAFPETADDIRRLVRFANQLAMRSYRLPITVRGTGLDKTGAAIGDGMLISTTRMNHIEEIDVRGRLVRVQPGITLGCLNAALHLHGLHLPIAYDHRATIGGLIANCPNDDLAARHGGIFHYIERAEVVLPSGDLVQFMPYTSRILDQKMQNTSAEGVLYRQIEQLLDQHGDTVVERSMRPFDAAGYANVTRVRQGHTTNLLPLLFASQGTLGIVTDVILRVDVAATERRSLVAVLRDERALLRVLNFIKDLEPAMVKVYDMRIITEATIAGNRPGLLEQSPEDGWLLEVSFDFRKSKTNRKLQQCLDVLPAGTFAVKETLENTVDFQELRSALLSYLNDNIDGERTPILDDVYIPSYRLQDFLQRLKLVEQTLNLELPLFGSFATSNYHVRPNIDYTSLAGRQLLVEFMRQYARLVADCEGSLTGGGPEGRVKTLPTTQPLPEAELRLYRDLKQAFDPQNILNPSVKLGAETKTILRHLRTTERTGLITP